MIRQPISGEAQGASVTTEGTNASSMFLQLAVSKEGIVAGTFYNETTGATHPVEGMVDEKTQRAVRKAADGTNANVVMETGVYNLTQDQTEVLVHFGPEQTQTWAMVRLDRKSIGLFLCWGVKFALAEGNTIEDSGPDDGVAVDVQGETEAVRITGNRLVETRAPAKRIGIRLGAKTRDIHLADNQIHGFATEVADLRGE